MVEKVVKSEEAAEAVLKTEREQQLLALTETLIAPEGFRVVDLDCRIGGRGLVRIYLERSHQSDGVSPSAPASPATIEDCAKLSPILGEALDQSGLFEGPYDLEVSSAGLERRLRCRSDFERYIGTEVKLKLWERLENRGANFTGILERTQPGLIVLKVGKESIEIPLSKMKQANVVWRPQA